MIKLLLAFVLYTALFADLEYNNYTQRYESSTGVEYQYNTEYPQDELLYSIDIEAQLRDENTYTTPSDVSDSLDGFASEYGVGIYEEY